MAPLRLWPGPSHQSVRALDRLTEVSAEHTLSQIRNPTLLHTVVTLFFRFLVRGSVLLYVLTQQCLYQVGVVDALFCLVLLRPQGPRRMGASSLARQDSSKTYASCRFCEWHRDDTCIPGDTYLVPVIAHIIYTIVCRHTCIHASSF